MNPAEAYETAVRDFIGDVLGERGRAFAADLGRFVQQIADSGFVNSLAQLLLKMTLPGVPDFYQGTELWDFNLVDPDNRRPVDFELRRRRLTNLLSEADNDPSAFASRLSRRWPDADIKLWVTSQTLALRREWPEVFSLGDYIPLAASGAAADHVIGFGRRWEQHWVIVAAGRHFYRLTGGRGTRKGQGAPQADCADTRLILPDDAPEAWRCVFSGRDFEASAAGSEPALALADLFSVFPVALLTSSSA
jgi:(1->4)-alpha-D-glucan 1-alpha-D-glucosylmutase